MGRRPGRKNQSGLTPQIIQEEKLKGLSQVQIANKYSVSEAYVSMLKTDLEGFIRTTRERVMDHFPWRVPAGFQGASINRRMRDHAEYMATGGYGMSADKLRRLRSFYRHLEDNGLVVEFHPDIPPSEGVVTGGFAFRNRMTSDGRLIIRVNEHTQLTPPGHSLWTLPTTRP